MRDDDDDVYDDGDDDDMMSIPESTYDECESDHRWALLLLSGVHGPRWTATNILERGVTPLLRRWTEGEVEDGAAAGAVRLTGKSDRGGVLIVRKGVMS